jgi:glucuronate isomerase
MKTFLGDDFLLDTETSRTLFRDFAQKLPIVDFHCHISAELIYENRVFADMAELWLAGDHYKWRLMRDMGVDERLCTGDAPGKDKFKAFASVLPYAIGNPIYHWAHLELSRYFSVNTPLSEDTAEDVWNRCNKKLQSLKPRDIISLSNVEIICTTDDPIDDLRYHELLAADGSSHTRVLPTFRPDKALAVDKPDFADYIKRLSEVTHKSISNVTDLKAALFSRIEYFADHGCRAADHGLDDINGDIASDEEAERIFKRAAAGMKITVAEARAFRLHMLLFLCAEYARKNWVCELHFGVKRNVNGKCFHTLGADTGFDAINPEPCMNALPKLLDTLESGGNLPKMLLFSINPNDNAAVNILAGCFPEKVRQGAAWWFNDTLDGMVEQLNKFAASHTLATHVGMLTDSRSLLSFSRHEYFRRILCGIIGRWVEKGLYPADINRLGEIISRICYGNAMTFFEFERD